MMEALLELKQALCGAVEPGDRAAVQAAYLAACREADRVMGLAE